MTTDDLYIESFKVGDKYDELRNKVVNNVISIAYEHIQDDEIGRDVLSDAIYEESNRWLGGWFMYPVYVTLHFGIYDVVDGCENDDSPSSKFMQEVSEEVELLLEDDGVVIID